jgi:hypothetical protein
MPELNEALNQSTGVGAGGTTAIADAVKPEAPVTSGVVDATVVDKKRSHKKQPAKPATPEAGTEPATVATTVVTPESGTEPATGTTPVAPPEKKKKVKKEITGEEKAKVQEFVRPPHEMLAKDVERLILDKKIAGHDIKKLPYKCGKIIFGLAAEGSGKDFRVIALKARKKTKSVAGKSRCIYYFGINEDHSAIVKEIPGTKTTKFGCCSVQCKKPIELVLDKVSFKESFNQKTEDVIAAISKLIDVTVEQKTAQYKALQEATKTKEKEATEKAAKKTKAEAKAD